MAYENKDRKCECHKCDANKACVYAWKFQRLGKEQGGLGKCALLAENNKKLQY
ncbi:hypothetical protein RFF05_06585 [Bengtsoniella intestinalis]|uniref:hypothetical protein n=1 Tax=Bengtsoniella intestinalis TaxID=3073143 RepID=UPI00391F18FF